MNRKFIYLLALAILSANPTLAMGQKRPDALARFLFQPELIMEYAGQLNLDEQQQDILKLELKNAQASIFDIKWQLNEESGKLKDILQTNPIDEEQMLDQVNRVMGLEQQIKRIHLTMLARLKNMLSEQQIRTLREIRRQKRTN